LKFQKKGFKIKGKETTQNKTRKKKKPPTTTTNDIVATNVSCFFTLYWNQALGFSCFLLEVPMA
jgi:hypothetical protein